MIRKVQEFAVATLVWVLPLVILHDAVELFVTLVTSEEAGHHHLDNHPGHAQKHSHQAGEEPRSHGYVAPIAIHQSAVSVTAEFAPVLATSTSQALLARFSDQLDSFSVCAPESSVDPPRVHRYLRLLVLNLLAPNSPPRAN